MKTTPITFIEKAGLNPYGSIEEDRLIVELLEAIAFILSEKHE